jgi:deoxyxylulose-5-phosphate synthase
MGDGCMMEGISHEVCSLAGTLKLGKLVAFYDDNGISIDGHVEGWFTDDTAARFEAYGWHVVRGVDGHDADSIKRAVEEARAVTDKPSLLMCKTIIGFGSPNKAGTHDSHGAPLGDAEIALTREALGSIWRWITPFARWLAVTAAEKRVCFACWQGWNHPPRVISSGRAHWFMSRNSTTSPQRPHWQNSWAISTFSRPASGLIAVIISPKTWSPSTGSGTFTSA